MKQLKNKFLFVISDLVLINTSFVISLFLRFDVNIPGYYLNMYLYSFWVFSLISLVIFYFFEFYNHDWRYMTVRNIVRIFMSVNISIAIYIVCLYFINQLTFPRTVIFMVALLSTCFITGSRLLVYVGFTYWNRHFNIKKGDSKRVIIIGAGDCGEMLVRDMGKNTHIPYKLIGFLDDNPKKEKMIIREIPVLGKVDQVERVVKEKKAEMIIIAIPSATTNQMKKIVFLCEKTGVELKQVPSLYDILDGSFNVNQIRDVKPADILGRDECVREISRTAEFLKDKVVMVTGAGGSIGSELCRQIISFKPKKLILLDNSEYGLYSIHNELSTKCSLSVLKPILADVQHKSKMENVFKESMPQIVFHAAAYKHVPLMEDHIDMAIKNNVLGTKNVATLSAKFLVDKFVMISTDKAVNPTSVMGATKRVAERLMQLLNKDSQTRFCAVRFGNVLGSAGSVLPLFKHQISEGGPLTVTHPEVIRYFMTISEAVHLVLTAGRISNGGEIFVLDMGEPIKILSMAESLIRLSGLEPYKDIDIKFTGLRPGEKMYEELLNKNEKIQKTENDKIFKTLAKDEEKEILFDDIEELWHFANGSNLDLAMSKLKHLVPEYKSDFCL